MFSFSFKLFLVICSSLFLKYLFSPFFSHVFPMAFSLTLKFLYGKYGHYIHSAKHNTGYLRIKGQDRVHYCIIYKIFKNPKI